MSLALERLYGNSVDDTNRNKFDKTKFDNAIEELHNHSGKIDIDLLGSEAVRQMTHETYSLLSGGIEKGIAEGLQQGIIQEINPEVVYALQNNAFIFSGLKSYHTLTEAGLSITDDKGQIKPFQTFLENVRQIHEKYNVAYLNAEYKHAVASSQMAAKWHEIETEKERYDLQYRTAGDNLVREEHAALNGVTLPADDPFWDKYYPPNGWGCRCTAVQVRKGKYQTTLDSAQAIEAGDMATARPKEAIFRTNAGKTLKIYPDKHPYNKAPKAVKAEIEKQAEEQAKKQRVEQMIAELPNTLTIEEKRIIAEHNLVLEKAFGITKGTAMTYDEANKGKENPEFSKGGGYHINCQTCTVTHWLRRLGFNVQAHPNVVLRKGHHGTAYDKLDKAGVKWTERFTNLDGTAVDYDYTYKWRIRKGYKTMTQARLQEYFNEKFSADGVYEIYCGWKGGNAHVFCAEVSDKKVRYFDPQSGKDDVSNYIQSMKPGMVGVIRIDDKKVNPKIGELFLNIK